MCAARSINARFLLLLEVYQIKVWQNLHLLYDKVNAKALNRRIKMLRYSVTILGIFMVFSTFGPAVSADSVMIGPANFIPASSEATYELPSGWYLYAQSGSQDRHFYAPVQLPHNAVISSVVVFYYDNDSGSLTVSLKRNNLYADSPAKFEQILCSWESAGAEAMAKSYKISPVAYSTVNNGGYIYRLDLYFSSETADDMISFGGVKIIYSTS